MSRPVSLLALALVLGCGNKVDHPAAAADCNPATTDCNGFTPPMSGQQGGGNEAGATSSPDGATLSGQVLAFSDDFFERGVVFSGDAEVSATGQSGARRQAHYDGQSFELEDVVKASSNWFMVEPEDTSGMLTTITPIDTRQINADSLNVGLASADTVDGMFVLLGAERSTQRAQIVLRVVDEQDRSVAGVIGQMTAEIIAYREAAGWISGDTETDDSGMIFFGNVPATPTLSKETIVLGGAVSARVDVSIRAGATSVVVAVVSP